MKKLLFILFIVLSIASNGQKPQILNGWRHASGCAASDADACAFITATGIIDLTIIDAVDDLVIAAKAHGWWSLSDAIYPVVGGTLTTCSYNLRNPATFQITWNNSPTVSSAGVTFVAASSQLGDTHLNARTDWTLTDSHMSFYVGTTTGNFTSEIGAYTGAGSGIYMFCNWSNNILVDYPENTTRVFAAHTGTNNQFYCSSRTGTTTSVYVDGALFGSATGTSNTPDNTSFKVGFGAGYSDKQCKFASIGKNLNSTIQADMYSDIAAFQTALGR